MNLTIDIGNTRTKLTLFRGNDIVVERSAEVLTAALIDDIISQYPVRRAIVCATGKMPDSIGHLQRIVPTVLLDSRTPLPIANCYATPETLGSDRIAVAVAAHALYPQQNVLVVDCGTAITYELVTADGRYLGGAIAPGLRLRFRALHDHTARLPLLAPEPEFDMLGNTTETCIRAGVQQGAIAEIDGYIEAMSKKIGHLETIITGGDAFFFADKLKNRIFVAPNLLPQGLNCILQYNDNQ